MNPCGHPPSLPVHGDNFRGDTVDHSADGHAKKDGNKKQILIFQLKPPSSHKSNETSLRIQKKAATCIPTIVRSSPMPIGISKNSIIVA